MHLSKMAKAVHLFVVHKGKICQSTHPNVDRQDTSPLKQYTLQFLMRSMFPVGFAIGLVVGICFWAQQPSLNQAKDPPGFAWYIAWAFTILATPLLGYFAREQVVSAVLGLCFAEFGVAAAILLPQAAHPMALPAIFTTFIIVTVGSSLAFSGNWVRKLGHV